METNETNYHGIRQHNLKEKNEKNRLGDAVQGIKSAKELLAFAHGSSTLPNEGSIFAETDRLNPVALMNAVASLASGFLKSKKMSVDDDFFHFGGSSMQALELASVISNKLGINISLDDLFSDARPRRIVQNWLQKQGIDISPIEERTTSISIDQKEVTSTSTVSHPSVNNQSMDNLEPEVRKQQIDDIRLIEEDMRFGDDLPWLEEPPNNSPKQILLTGATGFLGSHILFDLLRHSDANITCLVRATDDLEAEKRLSEELEKRDFIWSDELKRRVVAMAGDLGKPKLGWSDDIWLKQAEMIDSIVNVAAIVDFVRSYRSLRNINVYGVNTLVQFASTGLIKPLHQVSSLAVFNEYGISKMGEDDPPARLERLFVGYEKSKWASEAILRRARERGFCVTFLRPGGISGNTQTGVDNPLDLSSGLISAIQSMRLAPEFKYMNIAPVDWISRITAHVVIDPKSWGYNYHLLGKPLSFRQQIRELTISGMATKVVSFKEWREQFLKRMREDPIPSLKFLEIALKNKFATMLVATVFNWPKASADRVEALIAEHGLPERPDNGGKSQVRLLERLVREGRAKLPGRSDPPYLQFKETMKGSMHLFDDNVRHSSGDVESDCEFNFTLSVASFYQLLQERKINIQGHVTCKLLHNSPLGVEKGDIWVRPNDGVPLSHGMSHPLLKYKLFLVDDSNGRWWMEGIKTTRPGFNLFAQATTLQVNIGRVGQAPFCQGTMVVPLETYVDEQIRGLQVSSNVPEQEQYVAKAIWLGWFFGQLTLGFLDPLSRVIGGGLDVFRTLKDKGE